MKDRHSRLATSAMAEAIRKLASKVGLEKRDKVEVLKIKKG